MDLVVLNAYTSLEIPPKTNVVIPLEPYQVAACLRDLKTRDVGDESRIPHLSLHAKMHIRSEIAAEWRVHVGSLAYPLLPIEPVTDATLVSLRSALIFAHPFARHSSP